MQLEGGSDLLRALSYYMYYNDCSGRRAYGRKFREANMTRSLTSDCWTPTRVRLEHAYDRT